MDRIEILRPVRHRFQEGEEVEVVTLRPGEVYDIGTGPGEIPGYRARMYISQNQAAVYEGPVEPDEGEYAELGAEDAIELAEEADDLETVHRWLREERETKDRVTVVRALEERGDELFLELTLPEAEDSGLADDLFEAAEEHGIDLSELEPADGETVRVGDLVAVLEEAQEAAEDEPEEGDEEAADDEEGDDGDED